MTVSISALRQERLKKSARPNPPGLFTINEEDEPQKNGNSKRPKGRLQLCGAIRAAWGICCLLAREAQHFSGFSVCCRDSVTAAAGQCILAPPNALGVIGVRT